MKYILLKGAIPSL